MLHRREFICRFLRLLCLVYLLERGQEKNTVGGFRKCFTELNAYCRERILQSAEKDTFNLHIGIDFSVLIRSSNGRRAENRTEAPEKVTATFIRDILCGQKNVHMFYYWFTNVP